MLVSKRIAAEVSQCGPVRLMCGYGTDSSVVLEWLMFEPPE